jgi:hypothetical protein
MTTKQILYTLGILAVLAGIFGFLASFTKPIEPVAEESHVLAGALTDQGDFVYTEDKDYYTVKAAYPATTPLEPDADRKARAVIEQGIADEIAVFKSDNNLGALTAQDAQMQNLSKDRRYALDMEYREATSSGTVSYAYQVYADTLGAHPNLYYRTFVFDREGNRLSLGDLFVASSTGPGADYLNQISGAASVQVREELTRRLGEEPGDSFFDEGTAPNPENFQNFVIDGNDLVFLLPPYQVAAYAAGSFEVRIPLSQLSGALKPGI